MEFSTPKIHWNTLTKAMMNKKFKVAWAKFARTRLKTFSLKNCVNSITSFPAEKPGGTASKRAAPPDIYVYLFIIANQKLLCKTSDFCPFYRRASAGLQSREFDTPKSRKPYVALFFVNFENIVLRNSVNCGIIKLSILLRSSL